MIVYSWHKKNKTEITPQRVEELAAMGNDFNGLAQAFRVHTNTIYKHMQKVSVREAYDRGREVYEKRRKQ